MNLGSVDCNGKKETKEEARIWGCSIVLNELSGK